MNTCPNGDGVYSSTFKFCSCKDEPQNVTAACDSTCQAVTSTFYFNTDSSKYCCNFPCDYENSVCKTESELSMFAGGPTPTGNIPSMASGSSGSYECPAAMIAFKPACYSSIYSRRNLNNDDNKRNLASIATTFDQTLICLTSSVTTVAWQITTTSFPVYNKDHPINDDSPFDSSSFETLKTKLISSGVSLSTFIYSFSAVSDKIALVFNDFSSTSKLTVIALNRDSCSDGNILPLNSETLKSVGIDSATFLELTPMEGWLIIFPILFCIIGVLFGVIVKISETKIEKERLAKLRKKDFIREDGEVDRIEYLKDLYKVIKGCLDDIEDPETFKKMVEGDNNEFEHSQQNEKADEISNTVKRFFSDFRFNDGELVEEKAQNESTDPSDDSQRKLNNSSDMDDEDDEQSELESDMSYDEGDENSQEEFDPHLSDLLGEEPIEEQNEEDEDENKDIEAILAIKKENERKKKDYEDSLIKLGLSEDERRELMEKYEDSLRRAREMMEGDAETQEKKRIKRLEERRNKKQEGKMKLKDMDEAEREVYRKYKDRLED